MYEQKSNNFSWIWWKCGKSPARPANLRDITQNIRISALSSLFTVGYPMESGHAFFWPVFLRKTTMGQGILQSTYSRRQAKITMPIQPTHKAARLIGDR